MHMYMYTHARTHTYSYVYCCRQKWSHTYLYVYCCRQKWGQYDVLCHALDHVDAQVCSSVYVTSSYILCHIIIHTMSHHHTYYVTSSYMRWITLMLRYVQVSKETCLQGKRDLYVRQNRPVYRAKETYTCGKTDLWIGQKRPICTAKQTY
jgi:hypothetical protein